MIQCGFPDSSVGKESACNAGDHGWIPGSRRSTKEWTGYPLQYSWSSLVVQLVKNLPAIRETWVQSLGGKIPWKREVYPLQYSGLENSMDCIVHGSRRVGYDWATFTLLWWFNSLLCSTKFVSILLEIYYYFLNFRALQC